MLASRTKILQCSGVNASQGGERIEHFLLECFDYFYSKNSHFPRKEFCLLILDLQLLFKNIPKPFCK